MIPDYIIDELKLRLDAQSIHHSKAKAICRLLGLDLARSLETHATIDDTAARLRELLPAGEINEGAVWFQFETKAHDSERRVQGRIVFVTTPDEPDGPQGHLITECQTLVWRFGESAPTWQSFPEELLPPDLIEAAYQEIDALAPTRSTNRKSNA
jgi:hypothetical protein